MKEEKKGKNRILIMVVTIVSAMLTLGLFCFAVSAKPEVIFPAIEQEKTQILFLGDSNIDYSFGGTEIPEIIMQRIDVTAYNCAIGGTCAAKGTEPYERNNYYSMFSLFNLSRMIETGDFTVMKRNRRFMDSSSSDIKSKLLILEHLDYSAMDYVVLHYGMNDYFAGFPIRGEDPKDERTYQGALRCAIERIHKKCPQAQIILSSITYCRYREVSKDGVEAEESFSGLTHNNGIGIIEDYRDAMKEVAGEYEYTIFLDNLSGMKLDDSNYSEDGYFHDDIHLGEKGRELYAEGFLQMFSEIDGK